MTLSGFHRAALVLVFVVASLQVVGYATGSKTVRGLGLVTTASPLPFVLSAHGGLETFAQTYAVILHDAQGKTRRLDVDAARYGELPGAYNRRNAYGAAFSHGPVLEKAGEQDILDAVLRYGFCTERVLLREFGIDEAPARVVAESTAAADPENPWRYAVDCP